MVKFLFILNQTMLQNLGMDIRAERDSIIIEQETVFINKNYKQCKVCMV